MHIGKPAQNCSQEKITAFLFEAGLKCMTKCFFRSQGESWENTYVDWVMNQNESYRKEGAKRMIAATTQDDYINDSSRAGKLKESKWQLAVNLLDSTKNLESSLHAVERVHSKGRGKAEQFIPIRFIFSNRITKDDKLLMAFDALAFSKMLGYEIRLGKIIHGNSYTTMKVRTSILAKEVQKMTQKIETMISSNSPPDLVLNRHCTECEFQTRCKLKAIEKDDLSLLSGMTIQERKKFNSKGIFTITQLSYTFRPRRRARRSLANREKYHHSIRALSLREQKIHIVGRPELKIEGTQVFVDVEGLPDRDSYYLIGVRFNTPAGMIQHSLWAEKPDEEEKIWGDFLRILSGIDKPILIHYGSFETKFIRRMCNRYGKPSEGSQTAKAIGSMVNLVSIIFAQIYFPTFSNGLKEIAEYLGFTWSTPLTFGVQTIALRHEWEATGDSSLKGKILSYNAQDCEALQLVESKVEDLVQTSRDDRIGKSSLNVVHTETLKRDLPFGFRRNTFSFPELDAINKAAYWDYQRERVYVKSNAHLKKQLRPSPRHRRILQPNQTTDCPAPRSCPRCDSKSFFKDGKKSKTVADLRFMKNGVKRWIVLYRFHRYKCRRCGATFLPEERNWPRSKVGSGVIAYTLYLNIGLRISQENVDHSINRMFGYNLPRGITHRIKAKAAIIYAETYERLIRKLCSGQLIHADETKISVGGRDGFVWVLANMEEVAYIYSETRQGDILHRLLKDFTGVLVSDFYTAYDGIQCPQQRCLIHLIRDLNDAVLKCPFDEELKSLVKEFAKLVRPMVETVDRHGLKGYFLKKHLVAVNRFYRRISGTTFQSESAVKFKERFEKNRNKLFTFLTHDGVPWNNNNAEHAIKAFAMLRQVIEGLTSEKGLREYLIMLSILETCKYQSVDFLDFLLSGEKNIGAFVKSKRRR